MPQDIGSTTPSMAFAAMAASAAVPPRRSTSTPVSAASGWLVATIPCSAWTTDRPVQPARRRCRGTPMAISLMEAPS